MRGTVLIAVMSLAGAGAALARGAVDPASAASGTNDLSGINFNLAAPDYGKVEQLPEAATLSDLSAGQGSKPAAATTRTETKTVEKTAVRAAPRPVAKARPKPLPAANASWNGKPMSAWRRAYIAKHGHQPPVPAK